MRFSRVQTGRGFTLIELIVVIILLGVLAGMIAPRILSTGSRRAETSARAVAQLLSTLAYRDTINSDQLALHFDLENNRLELLKRRDSDEDDRRASEPREAEAGGFRPDPLVPPVELQSIEVRDVLVDGVSITEDEWTLRFSNTERRPQIALILETTPDVSRKRGWVIQLLPHASEATITSASGASAASQALEAVDLDAIGAGERTW